MLLESSSPMCGEPHKFINFILDVVWPELGVELLMSRLGITKEEAKTVLECDSRYDWSRIETLFR